MAAVKKVAVLTEEEKARLLQIDEKADEALLLKQQVEQLKELAEAKCELIMERFRESTAGKLERIQQLEQEIKAECLSVPHTTDTKTQWTRELTGCKVVVKKAHKEFNHDDKAILNKAVDDENLVAYVKYKTTASLDWNSLKSKLSITETGDIIDKETGEVVTIEGITVVEKPEEIILQ